MTIRYRHFLMDNARWEQIELRDDDIIIATPPKCGTTWMQMQCALLIFQTDQLPQPLTELSPWVDMLQQKIEVVAAQLAAQTHRRFIKSHTPLDGLPWDERVTYISVGRDPRDAAMSWANHRANLNIESMIAARADAVGLDDLAEWFPDGPPAAPPDDPAERFWNWIEYDPAPANGDRGGLPEMVDQVASFWARREEPNVLLFHYADMKADLDGEMRRLADALGIDVPEDKWPELVEAATFERMSARAGELAPQSTQDLWHSNAQFFHRGTHEQWRGVVDPADMPRYDDALAALARPDLVEWLHTGWRGSA